MTPAETVDAFIRAIEAKDLDRALSLVTDDVEYDNVPMPTVHGADAVRQFLEGFIGGAAEVSWVVHRQAADGPVVFNERTDRFLMDGRWVEIAVAGVWEVHDGRISLWRDYFDLQTFTDQLQAGG
jgi:limonene-1,2-epoxide hydrolase